MELMVSMAVILLLVAILVPVLVTVRERADQIESANRLRQCHLAHNLLAVEGGNRVTFMRGGGSFDPSQSWSRQLYNRGYVTDPRIFFMPGKEYGGAGRDIGSAWHWDTYGFNSSLEDGYANWWIDGIPGKMEINYTKVENPNKHILLAETRRFDNPERGYMTISKDSMFVGGIKLDKDGFSRIVYLSGAVSRISKEQLSELGFSHGVGPDGPTSF